MVAHFGVNFVGKVNGSGVDGQVVDVALGGEHKDFVIKDVDADGIHKFSCATCVLLCVHNFTKPTDFAFHIALHPRGFALFVFPVSGDTIFRNLVHFVGADLDFKGFVEACHHGGVQGLIIVCLGHCYIILESARYRLPKIVDKAKERVAILH